MSDAAMSPIRRMRDVKFDPELFFAYETKSLVDKLLSYLNGFHRGQNYSIFGDPGVGKTTLVMDMLANVQINYPDADILFISGEMTSINFHGYIQRYPKFADIPIIFTRELLKEFNPTSKGVWNTLQDILSEGFDIVAIDSLETMKHILKAELDISGIQAEQRIVQLAKEHNERSNKKRKYTIFLLIQQVTKGGVFAGTNALMHLTDASMQIRYEEIFDEDERYIFFDKHRIGKVGDKLYFTLNTVGDVSYNTERYNRDQQQKQLKVEERNRLKVSSEEFDAQFGLQPEEEIGKIPEINIPEKLTVTKN